MVTILPKRTLPRAVLPAVLIGLLAVWSSGETAEDDAVSEATKEDGLYVVFETTLGTIVCELFAEQVPVTVGNFTGLVTGEKEWRDPQTGEMVQRPFYDGLTIHRVNKDFMIQGGCPLGNGRGGPGYSFTDEFVESLRHDKPGVLSMANSGPNSNGSQFFITHGPTPWLDDKHTVFGQCVHGIDVVSEMAGVPMKGPQNSTPADDIVIEKARIVRTGSAAAAFDWKASFDRQEEIVARMKREKEEREATDRVEIAKELGIDLASLKRTEEGLEYVVRQEGTGAKPSTGQTITAHYTGYLLDGTKFDSSVDRGTPFKTPIGVQRVIKGWDIAFLDMQVGEKRVLFIPSELGYGARGAGGGRIPPNATLVFDVELLGVE
jgi:peptidylprolyl isomerase